MESKNIPAMKLASSQKNFISNDTKFHSTTAEKLGKSTNPSTATCEVDNAKSTGERLNEKEWNFYFRLTKTAIFDFFEKKISKSAIRKWDGEYCVIGKTCIVNLESDGVIDVWICNPKNMYVGLGQKAVRTRLKTFEAHDTSAVKELTGEAWVKTKDKNLVLRNLKLLGIRKRAIRSSETRKAMIENLKIAREKK